MIDLASLESHSIHRPLIGQVRMRGVNVKITVCAVGGQTVDSALRAAISKGKRKPGERPGPLPLRGRMSARSAESELAQMRTHYPMCEDRSITLCCSITER